MWPMEGFDSPVCSGCGATICENYETGPDTKKQIAAWNRRAADERVRALVEALKPFADAATAVDLDAGNDWCIWGPLNNKKELPQITVGHLRQAAAILRKHEKE